MSAAALGAAAGAVAEARQAAEGEQLGFLDVPATRRLSGDEARAEGEARRGRGRPKGAGNLVTRDLRRLLMAQGETPQEWMARWSSLEPEELADRLGCSKADAFDRIKSLKAELAPYLMPKMAPVDDAGLVAPMVSLVIGGRQANAEGAVPPWMRMLQVEGEAGEYQALSAPDAAVSNAKRKGEGEEP